MSLLFLNISFSVQDERGVLSTKTVDLCLMSLLISSIDSEALARIARDLSIVVVTYIRYPIARKFCPIETSLSTENLLKLRIFCRNSK